METAVGASRFPRLPDAAAPGAREASGRGLWLRHGDAAAAGATEGEPSMSLPPEKASELKQLIHQQLSKMDVHGRIREILAETIREELAPDQQQLSTEDLIKALKRRGIIDDVMKELNFVTDNVDQELPSSPKQPVCFTDRQSTLLKKSFGWKSFLGTSART